MLARLLALAAVLASLAPRTAVACAPCETGDPTLASPSWDVPYDGRVRLSLESRWRHESVAGAELDALDLSPSAAVSLFDRLTVALVVPVGARWIAHPNLAREEVLGLGDPELRARVVLLRDRRFAPAHVLSAAVSIDLPLAPPLTGDGGRLLSHDAQPGSGSADPALTLVYAFRAPPWSVMASLGWRWPTTGTAAYREGPSVDALVAAQWQPLPELGVRLGADVRSAIPARENERPVAGTGGLVLRAVPELVVAPTRDVFFSLSVGIPLATVDVGVRTFWPTTTLTVTGEVGR